MPITLVRKSPLEATEPETAAPVTLVKKTPLVDPIRPMASHESTSVMAHKPYTPPGQEEERQFQDWYAKQAAEHDLDPNPDAPDQFYDYRGAFRANATPDETGHWPSTFKKPGHPNEIVGGFNARTGERVRGTTRASESELVSLGWEPAAAKRLAETPEPTMMGDIGRKVASTADDLTLGPLRRRMVENVPRATAAGFLGVGESAWAGFQAAADTLGLSSFADYAKDVRHTAAANAQAVRGDQEGAGFIEKGIYSGAESIGAMIPSIGASVLTGNPELGLALMGGQTAAQSYGRGRDEGLTPGKAGLYAGIDGIVEMATEKIPLSRLLKDLDANTGLMKTLMHQAVTEVPGEEIATALQDLNEWAFLRPDATFKDYMAERPSAAAQTLIATLATTVGMTGAAHAAHGALVGDQQPPETTQDAPAPPEAPAPVQPTIAPETVASEPVAAPQPPAAPQSAASAPVETVAPTPDTRPKPVTYREKAQRVIEDNPAATAEDVAAALRLPFGAAKPLFDAVKADMAPVTETAVATAPDAEVVAPTLPPEMVQQLTDLGYDPESVNSMTLVDAQEALRGGEPSAPVPPAVPPAVGEPMSKDGMLSIAKDFANDPAQQAAVAEMKTAKRAEKPPRALPADTVTPEVTADEAVAPVGDETVNTGVEDVSTDAAVPPAGDGVEAREDSGDTEADAAAIAALPRSEIGWRKQRVADLSKKSSIGGGVLQDGTSFRIYETVPGSYTIRHTPDLAEIGTAHVQDQRPVQETDSERYKVAPGHYMSVVNIAPKFRRQGVGTAIYDAIERHRGEPLVPSPTYQSEGAKALWAKRSAVDTATPTAQTEPRADEGGDRGVAGEGPAGDAGGGRAVPGVPKGEPYRNVERAPRYFRAFQAAQRLDPNVDEAAFRREFDARHDLHDDIHDAEESRDADPRTLLKEIARLGGVFEKDSGQGGEMRRLREGSAFGRVGGVAGVLSNKRRRMVNVAVKIDGKIEIGRQMKGGLALDDMLLHLQSDGRWPWLQDINDLYDFLDTIKVHGVKEQATGPDDKALGIDHATDWWNSPWQAHDEVSADDSGDDSFDPEALEAPPEAAPQPLTAESIQKAMGYTKKQAAYTYAVADAIFDELTPHLRITKGGTPGSKALPQDVNEYAGDHRPPGPDDGAPLHDLTGNGAIYPDDVYSQRAVLYYGTGEDAADRQAFAVAHAAKGKPNATVTVYRAVPLDRAATIARLEEQKRQFLRRGTIPGDWHNNNGSKWYEWASDRIDKLKALPEEESRAINAGDWVAITRGYARDHGEGALRGEYKILTKKVKASEIFTNGDSIHEWGYWPGGKQTNATDTLYQRGGLFDDEDVLDTGEVQRRLPGDTGKVRDEERPTPKLSNIEDDFRLTSEVDKRKGHQTTLFQMAGADTWYYDNVQESMQTWQQKGTPEQVLAHLKKSKGALEEAKDIGLDTWLAGQKTVTREAVLDYVRQHAVTIDEKTLGSGAAEERVAAYDAVVAQAVSEDFTPQGARTYGRDAVRGDLSESQLRNQSAEMRAAVARLVAADEAMDENAKQTEYESYQLDGPKANYREILITLPAPVADRTALDAEEDRHAAIEERRTDAHESAETLKGWTELDEAQFQSSQASVRKARANYDRAQAASRANTYHPPHFNTPNLLLHLRVNDRTLADGRKVLFAEEMQSDWHQKGRRKGYRSAAGDAAAKAKADELRSEAARLLEEFQQAHAEAEEAANRLMDARRRVGSQATGVSEFSKTLGTPKSDAWHAANAASPEVQRLKVEHDRLNTRSADVAMRLSEANMAVNKAETPTGVPDAPFKDAGWKKLALKRLLAYAAEGGYDGIAWTTGEQQSARYDLSKQIDRIKYEPSREYKETVGSADSQTYRVYDVIAYGKDGLKVLEEEDIEADRLEQVLGKEMAQKIVNDEGQKAEKQDGYRAWRTLSGVDLKVGGEGMKGFYDRELVNLANDLAKRYGQRVEKGDAVTNDQQKLTPTQNGVTRGRWGVHDPITDDLWMDPRTTQEPTFDTRDEAVAFIATQGKAGVGGQEQVHVLATPQEMREAIQKYRLPLYQPAWHGSPHIFDEFKLHAIGTGEGAQAYGWGLYFAGDKAVATYYRDALTSRYGPRVKVTLSADAVEGKRAALVEAGWKPEHIDKLVDTLRAVDGNVNVALDGLSGAQSNRGDLVSGGAANILRSLYPSFKREPLGRLYKVDIPEHEDYLDWDKPLSEQSEKVRSIVEAIPEVGQKIAYETAATAASGGFVPGNYIYRQIVKSARSPKAASEALARAGIPGIRYLDGSSRGKHSWWKVNRGFGGGYSKHATRAAAETEAKGHDHWTIEEVDKPNYNYVVFDDKLVKIMEFEQRQAGADGAKASIEFEQTGDALIRALKNPDASSGIHELAHAARRWLLGRDILPERRRGITDQDIETAEKWAGAKNGVWSEQAEEKFARGFERYLRDGKAPTTSKAMRKIFSAFSEWLTDIYTTLKGSPINIDISPEMRQVYDNLITRKERNAAADRAANPPAGETQTAAKGPKTAAGKAFIAGQGFRAGTGPDVEYGITEAGKSDRMKAIEAEARAMAANGTVLTDEDVAVVRSVESALPKGAKGTLEAIENAAKDRLKQRGSTDVLYQRDERQTDTPAFKRWFGKSVVDGMMYHSTPYDFDEFDFSDAIGPHFGTKSAALDRGRTTGANTRDVTVEKSPDGPLWEVWIDGDLDSEHPTKAEAERAAKPLKKREPMAVWLKIEKPLRTPDMGTWGIGQALTYFKSKSLVTEKQSDRIWADWQKSDSLGWAALREQLISKGYDGIQYVNEVEDSGSTSWVPFSPQQIKSATGNKGTFDPKNPSILYQRDETKQTETPAFQRWFGNSEVINDAAEPQRVYHATSADFDTFKHGELGFHFGTASQANRRGGSVTLPVYLRIEKPARLTADPGYFGRLSFLDQLVTDKLLTTDERTSLLAKMDESDRKTAPQGTTAEREARFAVMRAALQAKGYDGVIYPNQFEDNLGNESYIAFEPTQIKSAIGNQGTFDNRNPSILYQRDGDATPQTLPLEDLEDLTTIGAAKVARGFTTREAFDAEMTREFGAETVGRMGDIFSEATKRATLVADLDIDDYFNFKRINVSEGEQASLRGLITETILRTGRVPKEKTTFDQIRAEAKEMGLDEIAQLKPFMESQAPFRAVRDAARRRINVLNQEIVNGRKALDGVPEEERLERERALEAKEQDVRGLLDTWMRMRSEDGRNLAMHRMMVDSLETWYDAAFWGSRAKRELGLPHGVDLPINVYRRLQDILHRGQQAVETGRAPEPFQLELSRYLASLRRNTFLEVVAALRKAGLLTGIKTHMRNVGGNTAFAVLEELSRVPSVVVDFAVSTATGRRTVHGISPRAVVASSKEAATNGVRDAVEVIKHGQTAGDLQRTDHKRELNSGSKVIDAYANFVFRTLSASDRIFRSYAFRRSLEEQAALQAINRGVSPIELLAKPTEAMLTQALADAEFATFNNQHMIATAMSKFKASLKREPSGAGTVAAFVVELAFPFVNTPSNIVARMFDYTPVGLGKAVTKAAGQKVGRMYRNQRAVSRGEIKAAIDQAMTPEQQRMFAQGIGRGATGSALIYLGWMLAAAGLASGLGGDDPGDRNVRDSAGILSGAVKIGGRWHQIASFSPAGNIVALGASLYRTSTQPLRKEAMRTMKMVGIGLGLVMEQPMLKGMADIVDAAQRPESAGENIISSTVGSFIPTFVNDIASAFDPYRRDARPKGGNSSLWTGAAARLPGLRNMLPARRDVFGRELDQDTVAIWSPTIGAVARDMSDQVLRELVKHDVGIGWQPKKDGETEDQYIERVKVTGDAMRQQITSVVSGDSYRGATEDRQAEMLEDAVQDARKRVRKLSPRPAPRKRFQ